MKPIKIFCICYFWLYFVWQNFQNGFCHIRLCSLLYALKICHCIDWHCSLLALYKLIKIYPSFIIVSVIRIWSLQLVIWFLTVKDLVRFWAMGKNCGLQVVFPQSFIMHCQTSFLLECHHHLSYLWIILSLSYLWNI